MAEKRSDYSDEDQPKSNSTSDPLAELARLIGQNDPFNDVGRPGARKPLDGTHADNRSAPEWLARPAPADDYDEHPAPRDAYRADPRYHQQNDHQDHATAHDDRSAQGAHEHDAAHDDARATPNMTTAIGSRRLRSAITTATTIMPTTATCRRTAKTTSHPAAAAAVCSRSRPFSVSR
jgi:hypothetical protein